MLNAAALAKGWLPEGSVVSGSVDVRVARAKEFVDQDTLVDRQAGRLGELDIRLCANPGDHAIDCGSRHLAVVDIPQVEDVLVAIFAQVLDSLTGHERDALVPMIV